MGGETATVILQKVPSVTVDSEGDVNLRRNSNVTLLIDEKPASQAGISKFKYQAGLRYEEVYTTSKS